MSSAIQDAPMLVSVPYSAYAEPAPYIPDPSYGIILRQKQATQHYSLPSDFVNTSSTIGNLALDPFYEPDKTLILKQAQSSLRSDIVDLDPDIRRLVNKNFKNLVWK